MAIKHIGFEGMKWVLVGVLGSFVFTSDVHAERRKLCGSQIVQAAYYVNTVEVEGRPAGSLCKMFIRNGNVIFYEVYLEDGEGCTDVYKNHRKKVLICQEFLGEVNGKQANRFFKKFKPDTGEIYRIAVKEPSKSLAAASDSGCDGERLQELEEENNKLKRLLGEAMLSQKTAIRE